MFTTLDTHLDTPAFLDTTHGYDIMERHDVDRDGTQVDYPRMNEGGLDGGFWAIYMGQGPLTPEGFQTVRDTALIRAMSIRSAVTAVAVLLSTATTQAELLKSSETGFTARNVVTIAATPDTVWAALIEPARWWNPAHSWSGQGANFSFDARAGGCFCEALPNGGSVEHQRVVFANPGKLLRLRGGLGPLQGEAISAVMDGWLPV